MTAPDIDDLELTYNELRGRVMALRAIAENMDRSPEGPGINWLVNGLENEIDNIAAFVEQEREANKIGPRAVT